MTERDKGQQIPEPTQEIRPQTISERLDLDFDAIAAGVDKKRGELTYKDIEPHLDADTKREIEEQVNAAVQQRKPTMDVVKDMDPLAWEKMKQMAAGELGKPVDQIVDFMRAYHSLEGKTSIGLYRYAQTHPGRSKGQSITAFLQAQAFPPRKPRSGQ